MRSETLSMAAALATICLSDHFALVKPNDCVQRDRIAYWNSCKPVAPVQPQYAQIVGAEFAAQGAAAAGREPDDRDSHVSVDEKLQAISNSDVDWELIVPGRVCPLISSRMQELAMLPDSRELTNSLLRTLTDKTRFVAAHVVLCLRQERPASLSSRRNQAEHEYNVNYRGLAVTVSFRARGTAWSKSVDYPNMDEQVAKLSQSWQKQFEFHKLKQVPLQLEKSTSNGVPMMYATSAAEDKVFPTAVEKMLRTGVVWRGAGLGWAVPDLESGSFDVVRKHPDLAIPILFSKLGTPEDFLVSHIALTQLFAPHEYFPRSRSNGQDVWYNGLSVKVETNPDTMEWIVTYPFVEQEKLELQLYWSFRFGDILRQK